MSMKGELIMARHKVEISGVNTSNIKVLSSKEMEELFIMAGCDKLVFPNNRKPWICDKVKYSLDNCKDIFLLNQILLASMQRFIKN